MTALKILTTETSVDSVTKALGGGRKVYPSIEAALAVLTAANESTSGFHGLPVALVGVDAEGNGDPEIYTEDMRVVVATVGTRVDSGTKKINGLKGIVVFPMPTLDAYLSNEAGRDWLDKIAEKESAHVAFRAFREAESEELFLDGAERAPRTVDDFVTGATRSDAVDDEAFSLIWKALRLRLAKEKAALAALFPTKPEVVKAIRSKAYATAEHPALEAKGVFLWLAKLVIAGGTSEKLDMSSVQAWIDGRDSLTLTKTVAKDLDFSVLDDLNLGGSNTETTEGEGDDSTDEVAEETKVDPKAK